MSHTWKDDDDDDEIHCSVYCRLEQSFLGQVFELCSLLDTGQ